MNNNLEVPNGISVAMLLLILLIAISFTALGIKKHELRKDSILFSVIAIVGMLIGGAIGLTLAINSKANYGEFWEAWPTLLGCFVGGMISIFFYVKHKAKKKNTA